MITVSSINELNTAKEALENLKENYPILFEKFIDMINLTRALEFKYYYMGCLLMDEEPNECSPNFVCDSVLRLYNRELKHLKEDPNIHILKQIFSDYENTIGYANLCLLGLDKNPESLVGPSIMK
ncbi:hypothetical protein [Bacillus massilinigeriensis]|uniref:hypothetical protein n=1 Tax=Bacillus massilionigeriensis TaxID=1805475 RepID=UPI00096B550E|nr:hypothetical protein [Bacillus massilionigeriensis]